MNGNGKKERERNGTLSCLAPPHKILDLTLLECTISIYKKRNVCEDGTSAPSHILTPDSAPYAGGVCPGGGVCPRWVLSGGVCQRGLVGGGVCRTFYDYTLRTDLVYTCSIEADNIAMQLWRRPASILLDIRYVHATHFRRRQDAYGSRLGSSNLL